MGVWSVCGVFECVWCELVWNMWCWEWCSQVCAWVCGVCGMCDACVLHEYQEFATTGGHEQVVYLRITTI